MKSSSIKLAGLALVAASLSLQLSSCVSTEREVSNSTVDPRSTYKPPVAGDRTRVGTKTVLNTVSRTHSFSDPKTKDNFILQLRGPRVLTAQAHFIVTSSTGDTLRHEVLPARALLSEKALSDPQAATVREKEIAILQGMNNFFADGRFSQPAVPADAVQPAELDTKTWAALREDPSIVGFDYIGAGGAERRMAYVRKLRKAVVINH
ncbi:hypothetical protein [Hymenobacter arizonensis]|uniref:Uncharacterized protein n=1 Tax=Hymenobacter arizonensis TaxID=1227077 RepID=A0A1I5TMF6_HYMAR|nr:hypothetical protein [Hymenobacter arizonensis]SFP84274.1 hypothetical protein SAMN04515668_0531 [Hymenobacter arizonensis]